MCGVLFQSLDNVAGLPNHEGAYHVLFIMWCSYLVRLRSLLVWTFSLMVCVNPRLARTIRATVLLWIGGDIACQSCPVAGVCLYLVLYNLICTRLVVQ